MIWVWGLPWPVTFARKVSSHSQIYPNIQISDLILIVAEEISGVFVKSISKGSAADLTRQIKVNDRIVEVNQISVIGHTNHQAVEMLRNTGPLVAIKLERYLRGPKYEQLQQAIRANELRPPSPPSPSVSSLPKIPLSLVVSRSFFLSGWNVPNFPFSYNCLQFWINHQKH